KLLRVYLLVFSDRPKRYRLSQRRDRYGIDPRKDALIPEVPTEIPLSGSLRSSQYPSYGTSSSLNSCSAGYSARPEPDSFRISESQEGSSGHMLELRECPGQYR